MVTPIYVRDAQGAEEALHPDQVRERLGVTWAPRLVLDQNMTMGPIAPRADEPVPQEWQRPALERFFGEVLLRTDGSNKNVVLKQFLYNREVANGSQSDLFLAPVSPEIGLGVFARFRIEPGDLVGEYTGLLRKSKPEDDNPYLFHYDFQRVVDAKDYGNYTRWINHSVKHANCGIAYAHLADGLHVLLIASQPIAAGQQLLFNYGPGYWRNRQPVNDLS